MSEILQLRGRLANAASIAKTVTTGIDTDIDELRMLADKFEDKEVLKTDRIVLVANRIDLEVKKLREVNALIVKIKKELGE